MPESCPFCNLDGRVLAENGSALLFLSNPRKVPGHFLVVPKRHVEKPWGMLQTEFEDVMELVFEAQMFLAESFPGGGCDVRQNYRPFMKQGRIKIDHVHYHIYPRSLHDELYHRVERFETDMFEDLPADEASQWSELFRSRH